ncbi:unnamed protein product [Trichobilharzia regenti]|nr:unnamed protein product [Trichobilharzia regenti]
MGELGSLHNVPFHPGPISRGKRMAGVMGNRYRNARGLMVS